MRWAASDELTTSTACTLLPYSCPMRWNTRSAPERSTRTETPASLSWKDFAIRSASGRSTDVYQATLPSFFAASINAGVIAVAGGAAARRGDANSADAVIEAEALSTSRRDNLLLRIAIPPCVVEFFFSLHLANISWIISDMFLFGQSACTFWGGVYPARIRQRSAGMRTCT